MRWSSRLSMTTPPSLRADRIAHGGGRWRRLALILGALGFQYIGGIAPCEMCHWQRWPHIAAAIIGILGGALVQRESTARTLAWTAIACVLVSGLIGAYQTGMRMAHPAGAGCLHGPSLMSWAATCRRRKCNAMW